MYRKYRKKKTTRQKPFQCGDSLAYEIKEPYNERTEKKREKEEQRRKEEIYEKERLEKKGKRTRTAS